MDVAQRLVAYGHSWSSVKEYTLSEIGCFLLAIHREEKRRRAEQLSALWMGSNLTKKGFDEVMSEYGVDVSPRAESASPQKVSQEWDRLRRFIGKEMR